MSPRKNEILIAAVTKRIKHQQQLQCVNHLAELLIRFSIAS